MTENHQQNGLSVLTGGWRASAGVAGLVSSEGCEKKMFQVTVFGLQIVGQFTVVARRRCLFNPASRLD